MAFVYDKKQLPQVLGLGVLSVGLLGYFCLKIVTPPPTQAATASAAGKKAASGAGASSTAGAADADAGAPAVDALIGAAAPTDAMRDPFAGPAMPAAVKVASAKIPAPNPIPGLPSVGEVSPLPVPAAAPRVWQVTGVVTSDLSPQESLAIFRSGADRRYIRLGEMVDDSTRLVGIDRDGVTVSRGNRQVRIALGGPPAQSAPQVPAQPAALPAAAPEAPPAPIVPKLPALGPAADAPPEIPAQQSMPPVLPTF